MVFISACGSTCPVIKFGLVAPFEGRYRPVGYDAIYAARLAVRERNAAGGVGGHRVELVAYDDSGDTMLAVERATQLALDPQVVAVIGHLRIETTRAAWDVYASQGLPLIAPVIPSDSLPDSPCTRCTSVPAAFRTGSTGANLRGSIGLDEFFAGRAVSGTMLVTGVPWPAHVPGSDTFISDYRSVSNGIEPGPYALATYEAVQLLFDALAATSGKLTRSSVGAQLAQRFDSQGARANVPVYLYRLDERGRPVLQK